MKSWLHLSLTDTFVTAASDRHTDTNVEKNTTFKELRLFFAVIQLTFSSSYSGLIAR